MGCESESMEYVITFGKKIKDIYIYIWMKVTWVEETGRKLCEEYKQKYENRQRYYSMK